MMLKSCESDAAVDADHGEDVAHADFAVVHYS